MDAVEVDGVRAARAVQVMDVDAAGVEQFDETSAVVLVAASGTVSNNATGGARERRSNRMRITVTREHGEWLTSDVAFVQETD